MLHKTTTSVSNSCKNPASTPAASQAAPGQPTSYFHFRFITIPLTLFSFLINIQRKKVSVNKKYTFVQAEKEKLQEDFSKLTREKDFIELRLRSYETENTQLAPTLEETQWEVSPESYV